MDNTISIWNTQDVLAQVASQLQGADLQTFAYLNRACYNAALPGTKIDLDRRIQRCRSLFKSMFPDDLFSVSSEFVMKAAAFIDVKQSYQKVVKSLFSHYLEKKHKELRALLKAIEENSGVQPEDVDDRAIKKVRQAYGVPVSEGFQMLNLFFEFSDEGANAQGQIDIYKLGQLSKTFIEKRLVDECVRFIVQANHDISQNIVCLCAEHLRKGKIDKACAIAWKVDCMKSTVLCRANLIEVKYNRCFTIPLFDISEIQWQADLIRELEEKTIFVKMMAWVWIDRPGEVNVIRVFLHFLFPDKQYRKAFLEECHRFYTEQQKQPVIFDYQKAGRLAARVLALMD